MSSNTLFKNTIFLTLRGLALIGIGTILITLDNNSSKSLVIIFALLELLTGALGLGFANSNKFMDQVPRKWLIIESCAEILLGLAALYLYFNSTKLVIDFMLVFASFAIAFCFMQVIYIFQVIQIGFGPNMPIIAARAAIALGFGIFGMALIFKSATTENGSMAMINLVGLGPILAGLAILAFRTKMFIIKRIK